MAVTMQGLRDFGSAVRSGAGRYFHGARGVVTRSATGALNYARGNKGKTAAYVAGGALGIGGGAYAAKKYKGGKASTATKKRSKSSFGR